MVVDNRTSIRELALDVTRNRLSLDKVAVIIVTLGRADLMNGDSLVWVLERFLAAVESVGFEGKVVMIGPWPSAHEQHWMLNELSNHQAEVLLHRNFPSQLVVADLRHVLYNERGMIKQCLNSFGITTNGIQELTKVLVQKVNIDLV